MSFYGFLWQNRNKRKALKTLILSALDNLHVIRLGFSKESYHADI